MECSTTITWFGPYYFNGDHENITEIGCVNRNILETSDISNNLDNKNVNKFVTHESAVCTLCYCILAA